MGRSSRPEFVMQKNKEYSISERLTYPSQPYPHGILFIFKQYDYLDLDTNYQQFSAPQDLQSQSTAENRDTTSRIKSTSSIELPFPKALSDDISLKIEGFEQDALTAAIAKGIKSYGDNTGGTLGSTVGNLAGGLQSMAGKAVQALKGFSFSGAGEGISEGLKKAQTALTGAVQEIAGIDNTTAAQAANYALRNFLPLPGDMGKTIDAVTGKAINPKETLSFGGVELKSYEFEWTLFPSSPQDSENIKAIVNLFKRNALPTFQNLGSLQRVFLNYPSVVETFLIGIDDTYFTKFKPAMISSVTVDYAGGGEMAIMKGGRPVAVKLGISIKELGIHTAEDYGATTPTPATNTDRTE